METFGRAKGRRPRTSRGIHTQGNEKIYVTPEVMSGRLDATTATRELANRLHFHSGASSRSGDIQVVSSTGQVKAQRPLRPKSAIAIVRPQAKHRTHTISNAEEPGAQARSTNQASSESLKQDELQLGSFTNEKRNVGSNQTEDEDSRLSPLSVLPNVSVKRPQTAAPTFTKIKLRTNSAGVDRRSMRKIVTAKRTESNVVKQRMELNTTGQFNNTFAYAIPLHCVDRTRLYNPYDIALISHEHLFPNSNGNQKYEALCDYYTISSQGYTFYAKDDHFQSFFSTCADWERQKKQFDHMRDLKTFKTFRCRKVLLAWKRDIVLDKMTVAKDQLLCSLFLLEPTLLMGMHKVWSLLRDVEQMIPIIDSQGQTITLDDFSSRQMEHMHALYEKIQRIDKDVFNAVVETAAQFLAEGEKSILPPKLTALYERPSSSRSWTKEKNAANYFVRNQERVAKAEAMLERRLKREGVNVSLLPSGRKPKVFKAREVEGGQPGIQWTRAAMKRRKCARLAAFIRLLDYMRIDMFYLLVQSMSESIFDRYCRGTHSYQVSKLLDGSIYLRAFHHTYQSEHNTGEVQTLNRRCAKVILSRGQVKRFLYNAWQCGLQPTSAPESNFTTVKKPTFHSGTFDELFGALLDARFPENQDEFSIDELLKVVEADLSRLLVLPAFRPDDTMYAMPVVQKVVNALANTPAFVVQLSLKECNGLSSVDIQPPLWEITSVTDKAVSELHLILEKCKLLAFFPELHQFADAEEYRSDVQSSPRRRSSITGEARRRSIITGISLAHDVEEMTDNKPSMVSAYVQERIEDDTQLQSIQKRIEGLIEQTVQSIEDVVSKYDSYLLLHEENKAMDVSDRWARFRSEAYDIQDMVKDLEMYRKQMADIESFKSSHMVGFILLDAEPLKQQLLPSARYCYESLCRLFPAMAQEKCTIFLQFLRDASQKTKKPRTSSLDLFMAYLINIQEMDEVIQDKEYDLTFLMNLFNMLKEQDIIIPSETLDLFTICEPELEALKAQIGTGLLSREADCKAYIPLLQAETEKLQKDLECLQSSANSVSTDSTQLHEINVALDTNRELQAQAEVLQNQSIRISKIASVLETVSSHPCHQVHDLGALTEQMSISFRLKNDIWESVCESTRYLDSMGNTRLKDIDLQSMNELVLRIRKTYERIQQETPYLVEVEDLKKALHILERLEPVIRDLRNEHITLHHWSKMEHKMECSFTTRICKRKDIADELGNTEEWIEVAHLDLPLRYILDINATEYSGVIHQISEEASAEAVVRETFEKIIREWQRKELPIVTLKDRHKRDGFGIGDCKELLALAEESDMLLRVMDSSSYSNVVQDRLPVFMKNLTVAKEMIELLQMVQARWDEIQPLFSHDFRRLFPEAAMAFQKSDDAWKKMTKEIAMMPSCMRFCTDEGNDSAVRDILAEMELVMKALHEHLESKRTTFAPLYRLSTLELASLFTQVNEASTVQRFLYMLFDNVHRIVLSDKDQSISSVISSAFPQWESIHMGINLKARGPVEIWLSAAYKRLCEQLKQCMKNAVKLLEWDEEIDPSKSIQCASELMRLPMQSITLADHVRRCTIINDVYKNSNSANEKSSAQSALLKLEEYHQHLLKVMDDMFLDEKALHSKKAFLPWFMTLKSCLFVQHVEYRDRIASLAQDPSPINTTVPWEHQLQYEFDEAVTMTDEVYVRINTFGRTFGFNYVTPSNLSVLSSQSIQQLLSIGACLKQALGCCLNGPKGSGKAFVAQQCSQLMGCMYFEARVHPFASLAQVLKLLAGAVVSTGVFCARLQAWTDSTLGIAKSCASLFMQIQEATLQQRTVEGIATCPLSVHRGLALFIAHSNTPVDTAATDLATKFCHYRNSIHVITLVQLNEMCLIETILCSHEIQDPKTVSHWICSVKDQLIMLSSMPSLLSFASIKNILASTLRKTTQLSRCRSQYDFATCFLAELRIFLAGKIPQKLYDELPSICTYDSITLSASSPEEVLTLQEPDVTDYTKFSAYFHRACEQLCLEKRSELYRMVYEMCDALALYRGVTITGIHRSGKSTALKVLHEMLHYACEVYEDELFDDRVQLCTLLPRSLSLDQLYGSWYSPDGLKSSVLHQPITKANELYQGNGKLNEKTVENVPPSFCQLVQMKSFVGVIFDGDLNSTWVDNVTNVLSPFDSLSPWLLRRQGDVKFIRQDTSIIPPNLRFIFESVSLDHASPVALTSAIICTNKMMQSDSEDEKGNRKADLSSYTLEDSLLHQFLIKQQWNITQSNTTPRMNDLLREWLVEKEVVMKILDVLCDYFPSSPIGKVQRTTHLCVLLSALMPSIIAVINKIPKQPAQVEQERQVVGATIIYSLVWGLCACSGDSQPLQRIISEMIKSTFLDVSAVWQHNGREFSMFDMVLDTERGRLISPQILLSSKSYQLETLQHSNSCQFIPSSRSIAIHALMGKVMESHQSMMLIGDSRSMKTTLMKNYLTQIDEVESSIKNASLLSFSSKEQNAGIGDELATTSASTSSENSTVFASTSRVRFHQLAVVTKLAARFRKLSKPTNQLHGQNLTKSTDVSIRPSTYYVPFYYALSSTESSISSLARCLDRMLQRERRGIYEPPPGKIALFYVDDLHLPPDEAYPSVHEYLRSVIETQTVYSVDHTNAKISIHDLITVTSLSSNSFFEPNIKTDLIKATKTLFPIQIPPADHLEIHTMFATILYTAWNRSSMSIERLSQEVRRAVPLLVAGTLILWERLCSLTSNLQQPKRFFNLHQLAHIFKSISRVEPSYLSDFPTLVRLWEHECLCTFSDSVASYAKTRQEIVGEVKMMKRNIESIERRQWEHRKENGNSIVVSTAATASLGRSQKSSEVPTTVNGYLNHLSKMANEQCSIRNPPLFQGRASLRRLRAAPDVSNQAVVSSRTTEASMWALVISDMYYAIVEDRHNEMDNSGQDDRRLRRSSIALIRKSTLNLKAATMKYLKQRTYAEVYTDVTPRDVIHNRMQLFYDAFLYYSTQHGTKRNIPGQFLALASGAKATNVIKPQISTDMAERIAKIERVHCMPGSKLLLVGTHGSGREEIVRYITSLNSEQKILTYEPVDCLTTTRRVWYKLLKEIFYRIGVDCQDVTLLLRHIDDLPSDIATDLLCLSSSGDISSHFTLEEQIELTANVRDEKLVYLENERERALREISYRNETQMNEAINEWKLENAEASTSEEQIAFQDIERNFEQLLLRNERKVKLRFQQEFDDYHRHAEVETDNMTSTIMSLMRPLGITSGKWQKIVASVRQKLHIIICVDQAEYTQVQEIYPTLTATYASIDLPRLRVDDLQSIVHGHLCAELQQCRKEMLNSFANGEGHSQGFGIKQILSELDQKLQLVARVVAEMHTSARKSIKTGYALQTKAALKIPAYFTRILIYLYNQEIASLERSERVVHSWDVVQTQLNNFKLEHEQQKQKLKELEQNIIQNSACEGELKLLLKQHEAIELEHRITVDKETEVMYEIEAQAQRELRIPLQILDEANDALSQLDKRHVVEIKSFTNPPALVCLVLEAVCVLFNLESTWGHARRLLHDSNFVQKMLTFDKDAISDEVIQTLEQNYLQHPQMTKEAVERQSVAAGKMVQWVRAMHQYAVIKKQVLPTVTLLEEARERLKSVQHKFYVSKEQAEETRASVLKCTEGLNASRGTQKECIDSIELLNMQMKHATDVLNELQVYAENHRDIIQSVQIGQSQGVIWWNALFYAGFISYNAYIENANKLFSEWERIYWTLCTNEDTRRHIRCRYMPSFHLELSTEEDDSSVNSSDGSSSEDEHQMPSPAAQEEVESVIELFYRKGSLQWELCHATDTLYSIKQLRNAFAFNLAMSSDFPLMLITQYSVIAEEMLQKSFEALWKSSRPKKISANARDVEDTILSAMTSGHVLLLMDVEPSHFMLNHALLSDAIAWKTKNYDGDVYLKRTVNDAENAQDNTILVNKSFRLILTSYMRLDTFGELLGDIPIISADLPSCQASMEIMDRLWAKGKDIASMQVRESLNSYSIHDAKWKEIYAEVGFKVEAVSMSKTYSLLEIVDVCEHYKRLVDLEVVCTRERTDIEVQLQSFDSKLPMAKLGQSLFCGMSCNFQTTSNGDEGRLSFGAFLELFVSTVSDVLAASKDDHGAETNMQQDHGYGISLSDKLGLTLRRRRSKAESMSALKLQVLERMLRSLYFLVHDSAHWCHLLLYVVQELEQKPRGSVLFNLTDLRDEIRLEKCASEGKLNADESYDDSLSFRALCILKQLEIILGKKTSFKILQSDVSDMELIAAVVHDDKQASDELINPLLDDVQSRWERVCIALCIRPTIVQPLCFEILSVHGIRLHDLCFTISQLPLHEAMQLFPATMATMLVSKAKASSFSFAANLFFHTTNSNNTRLQILHSLLCDEQLGINDYRTWCDHLDIILEGAAKLVSSKQHIRDLDNEKESLLLYDIKDVKTDESWQEVFQYASEGFEALRESQEVNCGLDSAPLEGETIRPDLSSEKCGRCILLHSTDCSAIPSHLRERIICAQLERTHTAITNYFQRCLMVSILRLATCSSFARHFNAQEKDVSKLEQIRGGENSASDRRTVWYSISALVLVHSLLTLRRIASPLLQNRLEGFNEFSESESLVLAINELISTMQSTKSGVRSALKMKERFLHAVQASYGVKAKSETEARLIVRLADQCFSLMTSKLNARPTHHTFSPKFPIVKADSVSPLTQRVATVKTGSMNSLTSIPLQPSPATQPLKQKPLGIPRLGSFGRAYSIRNLHTLSALDFPIDSLENGPETPGEWLELWWAYSTSIDTNLEKRVLRLFGLSTVQLSRARWGSSSLDEEEMVHKFMSRDYQGTVNSKRPQMVYNDVVKVLESIIDHELPKPSIGSVHGKLDSSEVERAHLQQQERYNGEVSHLEASFTHLLKALQEGYEEAKHQIITNDDTNGDFDDISVQQIAAFNSHYQKELKDVERILRNRIPLTVTTEKTKWMQTEWNLQNLLVYYQSWGLILNKHEEMDTSYFQFYAPAYNSPSCLRQLIDTAKQEYASKNDINLSLFDVSYELLVHEGEEDYDGVFALVHGFCLAGATWSSTYRRIEIDTSTTSNSRGKPVQLVCRLLPQDKAQQSHGVVLSRIELVPRIWQNEDYISFELPIDSQSLKTAPFATSYLTCDIPAKY